MALERSRTYAGNFTNLLTLKEFDLAIPVPHLANDFGKNRLRIDSAKIDGPRTMTSRYIRGNS
jgi:hypothetical protein